MALNTATSIKGDKQPKQDAEDLGTEQGTDPQAMSSIGDKNVSTNTMGGGDGSFPGSNPNEFVDPREVDGYDHETGELSGDAKQLISDATTDRETAVEEAHATEGDAQVDTEKGVAGQADDTDETVTREPSTGDDQANQTDRQGTTDVNTVRTL